MPPASSDCRPASSPRTGVSSAGASTQQTTFAGAEQAECGKGSRKMLVTHYYNSYDDYVSDSAMTTLALKLPEVLPL
jgi:hypothetical protein